jgi:multisubunit Na+/H+ antiporter MnhB subunit
VNIATRLIGILHRTPARKASLPESPLPSAAAKPPKSVNVAIYWLIGLIFMLVAQWALSSRPAQPLMDTTITSPSRQ